MSKPRVLVIPGSLRKGSHTAAVAQGLMHTAGDLAELHLLTLDAVPLYNADLDGPNPPAGVAAFKKAIHDSDGMVLISPEYNYGMPGVVKNAIDWASRPGFDSVLKGKPVLIITSSPGLMGGVRAQAQLRQTLMGTLSRVISVPEIVITQVGNQIEEGRLTNATTLKFMMAGFHTLLAEIAYGRKA